MINSLQNGTVPFLIPSCGCSKVSSALDIISSMTWLRLTDLTIVNHAVELNSVLTYTPTKLLHLTVVS